MLKPAPGVILRNQGSAHYLFDVRQGLLLPVNAMAAHIWRMIQDSATEEQIIEQLQDAFGSHAPDCLAGDVRDFLMALQKKRLMQEDGKNADAPEVQRENARDGRPLYHYCGMFGVMRSGYDAIVTEDVPFAAIQPGDVVAIHPEGPCASGLLFRVVKRTQTELTVQGDAEPRSARRILREADAPQRVAAFVDPANCRHEIRSGKAGLRQFRWHRLCRIGRALRDWLVTAMPWRKFPQETMVVNGEERYFDHIRLVARRWSETIQYLPWWNFLRFKVK